jgi:hypothetical protein
VYNKKKGYSFITDLIEDFHSVQLAQ